MKKQTGGKISAIIATILFLSLFFIAGCSSGTSGKSENSEVGSYSLNVEWPGDKQESSRTIPTDSSSIEVSISGDGLESAITSSITLPDSILTVSNIPAGNKVATIKAFDASSNLKAQRKVSFVIITDQTTTSDSVPLGIAITGDSSSPVFEPSSIEIPYGGYLYFQNWTDGSYTCIVNTNGSDTNLSVAAANQTGGAWTFPDQKVQAFQDCPYSIQGKSTATGTAYAPAKKYNSTRIFATDLYDPESAAVAKSGNIYIPDAKNNRILKYDSSYSLKQTIASYGTGTDNVYQPVGICIDSNENIYVSEYYNNRIHKFNSAGAHVTMWGSEGTSNSQFKNPYGIAINSANDALYVMDTYNYRIQKFNLNGGFLSKWAMMNIGNGSNIQGRGIAIDSNGNLLTTNWELHRIEKYSSTGTQLGTFGSPGTSNGSFYRPYGITQDKWGYIYVTNAGSNRIEKFDSSFNFVTNWGSLGTEQGQLSHPVGITIDENSNIIVIEWQNDRAQVFSPVQ